MLVKYAILTVIGDKKQTKTEQRYFFEKYSYLCFVRRNRNIILEFQLWDDEDKTRLSNHEELTESEWKIYHPAKKLKEKKPKEEQTKKEEKPMIERTTLNMIIQEKIYVTLWLVNGIGLNGNIITFDDNTILFEGKGKRKLIYKHSITTIDF